MNTIRNRLYIAVIILAALQFSACKSQDDALPRQFIDFRTLLKDPRVSYVLVVSGGTEFKVFNTNLDPYPPCGESPKDSPPPTSCVKPGDAEVAGNRLDVKVFQQSKADDKGSKQVDEGSGTYELLVVDPPPGRNKYYRRPPCGTHGGTAC